ncbi:lysophospholipid acyltransferase family protein [Salinibacterium sp. PAMC 21357]|uniref:lysophospholipid acyltransferase family protein n=1 Tax=Salinibacterium sp. PAMC 21357 TaxID=1112215 RepID=UPI00028960CD
MSSTPERQTRVKSEKTVVFRTLAFLILPAMTVIAKYKIHDAHNVPAQGAFVLSPNHYSKIDPVVIGVGMWKIGRMPRYMAKAALFDVPVMGWLLKKSGQVPVQRASQSRSGADPMKAARQIAEQGLAVVVYPEGTLTREPDMWPMRGKYGAVRTALDTGIPLIPSASWGAQEILPRYSKRISIFPRKTVHIIFGEPVDLSEFEGKHLDSRVLAEATEKLMTAITALLEELRGETAPKVRYNPADHGQSEVGRFDQR